jgi:LPXTG-motif cell wall-anchored protein
MRTLSFGKVLYDSEGNQITDQQVLQSKSAFSFRLYLGNEFAEQENLLPADMYTYYVKGPDRSYCKWDRANGKFVSLGAGVDTFEEFKNLSEAEQRAGTFTTSMYGAITNIPAGYTVEVRDLIVGTKYKVEEPDRELPKGYTRRDSDGYVRTDLAEGNVVYYTEGGTYGRHPETGNTVTAEPISDTIASKTESPKIEVRNQEGWGLTAQKEWTDKDFIVHDPIYMAVYLDNGHGQPGDLVEGSVRRLDTGGEEIYWFFPDLKIGGVPHSFSEFIVREVELEGTPSADPQTGAVTGYTGITIKEKGQSISVRGRTASGSVRLENYTVDYIPGQSTGQNENIRTDTVKNSRPGLQIYKTDWSGSTYLSGAVFTLKDSEGHDVGHATYTSDASGLVTTAYLNEGTFTLSEIRTPTGYAALDEPITITVSSQQPPSYDLTVPAGSTTYYISLSGPEGFYTSVPAAGSSMARINVKNRTVQDLKVVKVGNDGGTRIPLEGVHFALYAQVKDNEGNVRPAYSPETGYEDLVTGDDGLLSGINMSLGAGTYYLREKAAPSGYKNLSEDLCFTIGQDGTVTIHNAGYSDWLTRDTSVLGTVAYQISIVNTPLGITLRKTDEGGNPISGAKFVLSMKNSNGGFESVTGYGAGEEGLVDLTGKTEMTFTGLPGGIYLLTETDPPAGCVIMTRDIYFKVENGAVTLTDAAGDAKTYPGISLENNNTTIVVQNPHGGMLPSTGGPGTGLFTILGSLLTAGAGWMLWRRRKLI